MKHDVERMNVFLIMKRRRLLQIFFFFCFFTVAFGQRKEISQARQWIKHGNNLEQAENTMRGLLKDSVNRTNERIWLTLFDAVKRQYEQGNERLYLKQQYDTARLFTLARKMFDVLIHFDSIDAAPNCNGVIRPKYRDGHAQFLNQYRPNLFNGGTYFLHKQKYAEAYDLYDVYIGCADQPLFKKYDYEHTDRLMPEAAYWAAFCAYKQQRYDATLKHTPLALKDTTHYVYMLQYLADTYKAKKDTVRYLQTLREGFTIYPAFPFFFPRLVDYYVEHKNFDAAQEIIDRALTVDSTNHIYLFAKSTVLLNTGKYEECIVICDRLIACNDSMPEAYLNAGSAYFNQAVLLDKEMQISKQRRQQILDFYRKAKPYLERYRQLAPDMKQKWGVPLYTIYLNLNMGKEFDEIDKIIDIEKK